MEGAVVLIAMNTGEITPMKENSDKINGVYKKTHTEGHYKVERKFRTSLIKKKKCSQLQTVHFEAPQFIFPRRSFGKTVQALPFVKRLVTSMSMEIPFGNFFVNSASENSHLFSNNA